MDFRTEAMKVEIYTNFLYPGMILKGDGFDEHENKVIEKDIPIPRNVIVDLKNRGVIRIHYTRTKLKVKKNVSRNMVSDQHLEKAVSIIEDLQGLIKNEGTASHFPTAEIEEVVNAFISDIKQNSDAYLNLLDIYDMDDYTYTHSVNVSAISILLGLSLGMEGEKVKILGISGLLHDLGKTLISDKIIEKATPLSEEEWKILKNHPVYGYNILRGSNCFGPVIENTVLCHHENYMGGGYPLGIKNEKQNPYSQVVSIADVFDAMTSRRPYKQPVAFSDSFSFFMENSGKKFNPGYAQVFLRDMSRKLNEEAIYPENSFVLLNTGEIAYVIGYRVNQFTLRPIVNIFISPGMKDRGIDKLARHPIQIDLERDSTRFIVKRIMDENQIETFNRIINGV
ncbi:MAG: HD-GYP domain-containing protein [Brevinematales bacterium]|jgi:HD-GYP domain-containing protein (c-di-GMP phosphodiesterase class II)